MIQQSARDGQAGLAVGPNRSLAEPAREPGSAWPDHPGPKQRHGAGPLEGLLVNARYTTQLLPLQASLGLSGFIIYEAALSFLGFGIQDPTPTWGNMLSAAQSYMFQYPWLPLVSGPELTIATIPGLSNLRSGRISVIT